MFDQSFQFLKVASRTLNFLAGLALTIMMLLTVADVACRAAGHPLVGVYEVVALALAIVIGFGFPQTSLDKGHVFMEFVLEKLSQTGLKVLNTLTRLASLGLFALIGYNLFYIGAELYKSGEVSPTLKLPFYPVAYAVAVCCLLQAVVFIFDVVRIWRGQYE
jgi:TRAP-type C4-dicarboxylate transport system permease small subunit